MIQKIIYVNNSYSWKLFESESFADTLALGIAPINFKWESKYGSLESLDSQVSIKYLFYIKTGFFWGHVEKKYYLSCNSLCSLRSIYRILSNYTLSYDLLN